ncbi:DUF2513 domain-containing protein [Brytella acorum]|uniref:DUF2513 domain-containing protein n=1 Tax=Brytella acorum TaxID=2959299 RepID=UPI0025AE3C0D|nr:DUF2513 domain-containing protein [Brytella acorum]MDF3626197.1 DUF2513 domain-containing protein [Brytella acorum]
MKRDMDLVREILLAIEADEQLNGMGIHEFRDPGDLGISDCSPERFVYAQLLLVDAGFLRAKTDGWVPSISGLTWEGHEFLDTVRDPEIWRKTKEQTRGVASVGIGFLWEIAKGEIRMKLGLP